MRFKGIKPGMVIHCPKEEDARTLLEHLENNGYKDNNTIMSPRINPSRYCRIIDDWGYQWYCEVATTISIIEFSDLLEPEPRFKVGDKVRVKKIKQEDWHDVPVSAIAERYEGAEFTITTVTECSDGVLYATNENGYNWSEEILEPVTSSEMSAEEVLEWFTKADQDKIFDVFGCTAWSNVFKFNSPQEIVDKITAYEAAKKSPKPVEVKWVQLCRIIQIKDDGIKKVVYEEEVGYDKDIAVSPKGQTEDILKKYISGHDGRYIAVIEDVCRVKEDEA